MLASAKVRKGGTVIEKYLDYEPQIGAGVYVAPQALVLGRVTLGDNVSIWPGTVLRGDINQIAIGAYTNIQDLCVGHVEDDLPLNVGAYVTVGHAAILHACEVGDGCLIGMAAVVLNGGRVGAGTTLGAGSLVPPGKEIPAGVLALGSPAKVVRELTEEEIAHNRYWAEKYARHAATFLAK
ncbi:MAG: gamma carbonic anhydrase family protein [Candidatus Coatesbacteria bacterium]|nr:MAG: gamma carbonic anhydrase family protein [Candidatus Coatesbacteria bacterium]